MCHFYVSKNQHAIYNKITKKQKRDHWLNHADDTYDNKLIEDIKIALGVLKLFVPLPIFWALYDQQGSQWTFQATRMNGQIGSFVVLPDQLQAVNPLLILIFIPIFESCIYPVFAKIHFIDTPLKKLVVGGFLASVAFIVAGIVELELEVVTEKFFICYEKYLIFICVSRSFKDMEIFYINYLYIILRDIFLYALSNSNYMITNARSPKKYEK